MRAPIILAALITVIGPGCPPSETTTETEVEAPEPAPVEEAEAAEEEKTEEVIEEEPAPE